MLDYFEPAKSDSRVEDLLSDVELILFIVNRILSSVSQHANEAIKIITSFLKLDLLVLL